MLKFFCLITTFLAVSCRRVHLSGYPMEGPYYDIPYITAGPAVQVRQMWMPAGSDQVTRKRNFIASITFQPAASSAAASEGSIVFGTPRSLPDDQGAGVWTRIVPVRSTDLLVRLQDDYKRRITISVLDHDGRYRELASFPHAGQNPDDGVCALTRSGRYALVVRPSKVSLWDVPNWREENVEDAKELLEIRAALMKGTGNPGNWWLTDDLQYVVIDSTHEEWDANGGYGPVYAKPFDLAKLSLDAAKDAVVFDRKSGRFSVFESHIPSSVPGTFEIADAESIGGKIRLLYALNVEGLRIAVADTEGHVRASHTVSSYTARLAGWDPEHDEIWIQTRDANGGLPNDQPQTDHHLIAWNVGKDTERRFRVPVDQIRKAVDNAK